MCHAQVAEELWRLAVVNADLPRHLQVLRDYFLLAKGDFFQCFLQEVGAPCPQYGWYCTCQTLACLVARLSSLSLHVQARSLLALPPKAATAESDIAVPLQQAASKVGADLDPLFQRVRITFRVRWGAGEARTDGVMPKPGTPMQVASACNTCHVQEPTSVSTSGIAAAPESTRVLTTHAVKLDGRALYVPAYDQWDGLGLDYRLDWPLHLLLTPEVGSTAVPRCQGCATCARPRIEMPCTT